MPKKLERCVADLVKTGKKQGAAYAICQQAMKPKPRPKGR